MNKSIAAENVSLIPVISVDPGKCVNCHMCIAVCPVKYCIDGSGDKVTINPDLCIGCGNCVAACTQHARAIIDDSGAFLAALKHGEKLVAIAAPAIVSSFPGEYKRVIGWLKKKGVAACFDVSFGAELTVRSYLEYLKDTKPKMVIAQPCPTIINYIEIYHPELIQYLAPADSPMLHTIKMIREFYPDYRSHKILVLSPCVSKRHEFRETGIDAYNVTYRSLDAIMKDEGVDLSRQPEAAFDSPLPERGVLFSTPGGLMRTAMRDSPGIESATRRIEDPEHVYHYLADLSKSIEKGINPLLIDCLNCTLGCNGGPGTLSREKSPDELEQPVEKRADEGQLHYGGKNRSRKQSQKQMARLISKYWRPGLYVRSYVDRSANNRLGMPTEAQCDEIYAALLKQTEADRLNCGSCGYKSCRGMAIAIFNGLNQRDNCHLYRQRIIEREQQVVVESSGKLHEAISRTANMVGQIQTSLAKLQEQCSGQFLAIEQTSEAVKLMSSTLSTASDVASGKRSQIDMLAATATTGTHDMHATMSAMRSMSDDVSGIGEMVTVIRSVAQETNMLAMNAAIEAAHAGHAGSSFAVVASEIRKLAETTGGNASHIAGSIHTLVKQIRETGELTERTGGSIQTMSENVSDMAGTMTTLINSLDAISTNGFRVQSGIDHLWNNSLEVKEAYTSMVSDITSILGKIDEISTISDETRKTIDAISAH